MTPSLLAGGQSSVVTDPSAFAAMKPEWDALYERCATSTPFQSHAWLTSWWQWYGGRSRLHVLLLRHQDRLVAALPLMRTRRWGCRVLSPLGVGLSDYTDVLLDEAHRDGLARTASEALLGLPGWDVMDFPEAQPGAALETLHACWPGRRWLMEGSSCLYMPALPLEDQLAALGTRTAGKLRRGLYKIDKLDLQVHAVTPEQVPAAMEDLLRLHALQWAGRPINKEHLSPRFQAHLTRSATELIATGRAALTEFRVGERLVAADFCLIGADFAGGYLYGADPWLRTRVDTFAMVLRHGLRQAHARRLEKLSLLRGAEPHKAKWGAKAIGNRRMIFGRTHRAGPYAALVRARIRAARTLKERLPAKAGS
ncbi:GNAT family N-acetyltransferase [Nonomuraea sp. NPDC059023]|uniref:GNAT family N-acetyltransferase n=1 Tax=unclassified Nonomuraea TaxID=2593643 RepID=UPI003698A1F4